MSTEDTRLAELRAKRVALEEQIEARERAELEESVAAEERKIRDLEAIAAAQVEHGAGAIAAVETEGGVVIVRRPNHLVYKRFRDSDLKSAAIEQLVVACRAYPEKAAFAALLEQYPALLDRLGNELVVLAEGRAKEVRGK